MNIMVNGNPKACSQKTNLRALIATVCRDSQHVIAELNGRIVKSADWKQTLLRDGDKIELVTFVGGG